MGKIIYGDLETNGDFVSASINRDRLNYTIVNLTKAFFKNNVLVEAKLSFFGLAFDGSPDKAGIRKMRYWRDEINLNH